MFAQKFVKMPLTKSKFRFIRNYSAAFGITSSMPRIPLNKKFPTDTTLHKPKSIEITNEPIIKSLSNGILTAAKETGEILSLVGVAVKPSADLETKNIYGHGNFISRMAFSTTTTTTSFAISQQLQQLGAQIKTEFTREGTFYSIEVIRKFVPTALDILADCVFNPAYLIHEVNNAKFDYIKSLETIGTEEEIEDDIHSAAYNRIGMGLPMIANRESVDKMTTKELRSFHSRSHHPGRVAVSGIGVDPVLFAESAEEFFGKVAADDKGVIGKSVESEIYEGGEIIKNDDDPNKCSFFTLGFKSPGWHSDDVPALCVLSSLMGGGNSFSVGGPGKGMHSRLYTNVLNGDVNVNSCNVILHMHENNGIFGISASSNYDSAKEMSKVVLRETKNLLRPNLLTEEAFLRARNAALSTFLINLENRHTLADDYAKQLLLYKRVYPVDELKRKLQQVKKSDIIRLAAKMLKTKPSIVANGNTKNMLKMNQIIEELKKI